MKPVLACLACSVALLAPAAARGAPSVWVIDDGEKIKRDATALPFETGADNPVWSPGQPIRLFSIQNETVAFQVVIEADDAGLDDVTVDLDSLAGPGGATIQNTPRAADPTKFVGRPIERFVEHFVHVARPSGNEREPGASIGWSAGSGPPSGAWTGWVPDALIPVEVAKSWAPYPLHVAPRENGVVWVDVTVPGAQAAGTYRGSVSVKTGSASLVTIPIELEIADARLPDRPIKTMLFYDRRELDRRIGGGDAVEEHLWQLLHRHRLTAMHNVAKDGDLEPRLPALDGSVFTAARGYEGPGAGLGDGVLALGAYGQLGEPGAEGLAYVERVADALASRGLFASTDVFVYASDEDCDSPYGKAWRALLAKSTHASVKHVRVGWTCSEDPATQSVDIAIQLTGFDPAKTKRARAIGKEVWVYNGMRPHDGTFLTDSEAVSLRVNGWLGGMFDIGRWFYWETTFWYDDNRGGKGAYDPFATAETFHNADGDYCMGDGVLLYPGNQVDVFATHSLGMNGVVASIRLKSWRRGIEDAGYYQLARAVDASKADAIAKRLFPAVMSAAKPGDPVSWSERGKPYFDARKALLDLIPRGQGTAIKTNPVGPASPGPEAGPSDASRRGGCSCRPGCGRGSAAAGTSAMLVLALALRAKRRR